MILYAVAVLLLAFIFKFFVFNFSGDVFDTPEEALPKDADYVWIEGPKSEKEQRYFFLSNGNYFGTGVVQKSLKGWKSGEGAYAKLPNLLKENEINAAYSDGKIIFGLIKPLGDVEVKVNGEQASFTELASLSKETVELYGVKDYLIWHLDLEKLKNSEHFTIQVLNKKGETISELKI